MYAPQGIKELPLGTEKNLAGTALLRDQPEATVRRLEKISRWYSCPRGVQVFDRTDRRRDVYFILRHLESDVTAVPDHLGADLDQPLPQRR